LRGRGPYQADSTLHPVCALTEAPNSYPSGHALTGYLEGFTLAELVPAKRTEILARADDYAHKRLVCGVHYPSDIEASRRVGYVVFGYMMATPQFQRDLAAARAEMQAKLGLAAK
jgi:acid phosphatase (class A)